MDGTVLSGHAAVDQSALTGESTGIGTTEKGNGSITVDIAVQVIQALGETDEPDAQSAVLNAWGIQPDN